jgi:hypothetical protein
MPIRGARDLLDVEAVSPREKTVPLNRSSSEISRTSRLWKYLAAATSTS